MSVQAFPDPIGIISGQQDGGCHTLIEITQNGRKHRHLRKTADLLHFRKVLVLQIDAVDPVAFMSDIPVFVLILRDQALTAAAVPGQRVSCQRKIRRNQTTAHQRIHTSDKPAGMAAGIGQTLGISDGIPML